jgi:hypothetical protein
VVADGVEGTITGVDASEDDEEVGGTASLTIFCFAAPFFLPIVGIVFGLTRERERDEKNLNYKKGTGRLKAKVADCFVGQISCVPLEWLLRSRKTNEQGSSKLRSKVY